MIPAASNTQARGKIFRCPVHGLIRVEPEDQFVLELIDAPEFQRLRRVRQLGVSSLTYPGAEHSRFAHSLGVFNYAQRILGVLRARYGVASSLGRLLNDDNMRAVKAAALLHDIGHGPFSHLIERAFSSSANHEDQTSALIRSGDSDLPAILRKAGLDPNRVSDLIAKVVPDHERLLVDVVSSQLDADRMDYILRDAAATGVRYGSFDAEWLLNSLCVGLEPNRQANDGEPSWRLCLEERRGLHSAEQLMVARMHMSLQVYFHRATRGWEAHLLSLFGLAGEMARADRLPADTPEVARRFFASSGALPSADFLYFDEATLLAAMQAWARGPATAGDDNANCLRDLSAAYLRRQKLFRCRELPGELAPMEIMRLTRKLDEAGKQNRDWHLDAPSFDSYKDFGTVFRRQKKSTDPGATSTGAILIASGELHDVARPVEEQSTIFKAMGDDPRASSLNRLYYHHRLTPVVEKLLE